MIPTYKLTSIDGRRMEATHSLTQNFPIKHFPQRSGECYHYAPNTAALLYRVHPFRHRGKEHPFQTQFHAEALEAQKNAGEHRSRVACIGHAGASAGNSALYTARAEGYGYAWEHYGYIFYKGMPDNAAMTFYRELPNPLDSYIVQELGGKRGTKIRDVDVDHMRMFFANWAIEQPYYFPALRIAELQMWKFRSWDLHEYPHMSLASVSRTPHAAIFKEAGNIRTPSPDLFDKEGNAIPSKTSVKPPSRLKHLGGLIDRAALIYDLFFPDDSWDGYRADGNPTNDRIENLVRDIRTARSKTRHMDLFEYSVRTRDAVFPYSKLLPGDLHFTRGWRYGIERLAFDIDEHPL